MTVVRPHLQWGVADVDEEGRVAGFVEKPRSEHWINGGFFCFEPEALSYMEDGQRARARAAEAARRRGPAPRPPPRGLLGLHGHLQGRGRPQRPLGPGRGARGRRWAPSAGRGRVKRSLVTGGHGFIASHLARALLERGDAVDRPRPARATPAAVSGLALQGIAAEVELVEADLRDAARGRRRRSTPASSTRSSTSPPRRSSAPAMADPAGDLRGQRARHLDPARGLPPRRRPGGRRRLLRQGLRPQPRSCPTARRCQLRARLSLRGEQGGRRRDRAQLPARPSACRSRSPASPTSTAAATSTSRGWSPRRSSPCSRAAGRRSAPTAAPSATSSTSTTRSPPTWRSSTRSAPAGRRRARRSTPAASGRTRSPRCWRRSPRSAAAPVEPEYLGTGSPAGEIDRQYVDSSKLRELTGWRPEVELRDGLRRTLEWYRDNPEVVVADVRALHGHHQGHEEDRRPIPGRAREGAGAKRRRRSAAALARAGREGRARAGSLQRRAQPGDPHRALLARPRGGGARRARGAADALGPGAALGQGPQGRLQDDQRQSREPDLEPRLRAAGRQVPPPLPDRRRRLLRVDAGRGPQAAAPALALRGRRRRAVRLRRDLHPQGVGRRGGARAPTTAGSTAARSSPRPPTTSSPRSTTGCR